MNGIKRTYYITSELEDGIRKLAYLRKTTMSAIVREAIEWYIVLHDDAEPTRVDSLKSHLIEQAYKKRDGEQTEKEII